LMVCSNIKNFVDNSCRNGFVLIAEKVPKQRSILIHTRF